MSRSKRSRPNLGATPFQPIKWTPRSVTWERGFSGITPEELRRIGEWMAILRQEYDLLSDGGAQYTVFTPDNDVIFAEVDERNGLVIALVRPQKGGAFIWHLVRERDLQKCPWIPFARPEDFMSLLIEFVNRSREQGFDPFTEEDVEEPDPGVFRPAVPWECEPGR